MYLVSREAWTPYHYATTDLVNCYNSLSVKLCLQSFEVVTTWVTFRVFFQSFMYCIWFSVLPFFIGHLTLQCRTVYGEVKKTNYKWICTAYILNICSHTDLHSRHFWFTWSTWVANLKTTTTTSSSSSAAAAALGVLCNGMGPSDCVMGTISSRACLFYFEGLLVLVTSLMPFFCQMMCSSPRCCAAFCNIKYFYNVNHFQIILCVSVWGAALLNMIIVLHVCCVFQCFWRWYSHVKTCSVYVIEP